MTWPRLCYAAFMLLALVVFVTARHFMPRPPGLVALPPRKRLALALSAFVGGSLGGKLLFTLQYPSRWLDFSAWPQQLLQDGKTIMGGLIGAYLAVELTKYVLDVRVKTGDTFALPLALAMSVGRWGCFFNGCCYGVETGLPWGVWFWVPDQGRWLKCHPTQLYEVAFHFTMAVVLLWLMLRGRLGCQRLKLYLIAYGVYRFGTEFIRPEPVWWAGVTFYQWAAVVLVAGMVAQWVVDRGVGKRETINRARGEEARNDKSGLGRGVMDPVR